MSDQAELKECPFCAEKINAKAIKCKFCGSMLNETLSPQVAGANLPMPGAATPPQAPAIDKGKALEEFIRAYHQSHRIAHPIPQKVTGGGMMGFLKNQFAKEGSSVYFEEEITPDILKAHSKYTEGLNPQVERPLFAVNEPQALTMPSGVVLTSQKLYYSIVPGKTFSLGLGALKPTRGNIAIADIRSVNMGDSDTALGSAYQGHDFYLNGQKIGWLRMGTDICSDDEVEECTKDLFNKLTAQIFGV